MKLTSMGLKAFALAFLIGGAASAAGQSYPNRAVKVLVGYGPGGSPDTVGRLIADHLTKSLGQPFVIDNKPGASGTLATTLTMQAAADGYTLLIAETGQLEIAPQMVKVPYDPVKDFAHVGLLTRTPLVMVVSTKASQVRTLQELIQDAKSKPGTITYGTSGIGSGQHLAWEVFKYRAGIDLTHVPYKGATQSVPAIIGGEVTLIMGSMSALAPLVRAGSVAPIAIASTARVQSIPDVPYVAEIVPGYEDFSSEIGLMAPAGLPQDVLAKLLAGARAGLDSQEVRGKLDSLGLNAAWTPSKSYADLIRQNLKKYEQAIRISKIQPQ